MIVGLIPEGLMQDFKMSIAQESAEQNLIFSNYQKLNSCLQQKISVLENEKVKLPFYLCPISNCIGQTLDGLIFLLQILLDSQLVDLQKQLLETKLDAQNSQNSLMVGLYFMICDLYYLIFV